MLYVLTLRMRGPLGNEWRPVAVVDDQSVADQWANSSDEHDWIGFELNDLSVTGLSEKKFEPKKPAPDEELAESTAAKLQKTNATLMSIIQQLAERYKDKSVLAVLEDLKKEGKISSKQAAEFDELREGQRVWWGYGKNPPAGTIVKLRKDRKNPDHSVATVKWDDEKYGQFDIHINKLSIGQKALFEETRLYASEDKTADLSWMKATYWHENKPYHALTCPWRKDMYAKCDCFQDRLKGGVMGCEECGGTQQTGHDPSCPRLKQQELFASSLLRKQK